MFLEKDKLKVLLKRVTLFIVVLSILHPSIVMADTYYTDVPKTHWINSILEHLLENKVVEPTTNFNLGSHLTKSDWYQLIQTSIFSQSTTTLNISAFDSNKKITRIESLELLINQMGLDGVKETIKTGATDFIDTKGYESIMQLAQDLGWVSVNATKTFRPNDLITKEESYALLYNVYVSQSFNLEVLHSYYAISSFNQIELSSDLSALSYGWGRLEFNNDKSSILINMTGANNNEYRVPTGYTSALTGSDHDGLLKQLMLFVNDESVYDAKTNKNIRLADYILMDEKRSESVATQIVDTLLSNSYNLSFDGVLIDFEGLKGEAQAVNFNRFIKVLKSKLSIHDLKLTVAVHPVRQNGLSYYDGYDYKTIGSYADYVVLMAHDYEPKRLSLTEMEAGYTVTPLAPIDEVYIALKAITNPKTGVEDHSKILLQFSMDTVQWKVKEGKIINEVPYRPSYSSIHSKLTTDAISAFSLNLQSPYLIFVDESDGTRNVIWYEDASSIQAKINLAKAFKIGGLSVWRLGTIPNFGTESETESPLDIWGQIKSNYDLE